MASDFFCSMFSFYLALVVRHGSFDIPGFKTRSLIFTLLSVALIQSVTFYFMGIYKGIWRYSSTYDLIRLLKASTAAIVLTLTGMFLLTRLDFIPRTTLIIDWLLLIISLGGARLGYRLIRDNHIQNTSNNESLIIFGTGDAAEQLYREIKRSPEHMVKTIGFVSENKNDSGRFIHGIPILGHISNFKEIVQQYCPERIYVILNNPSPHLFKEILLATKGYNTTIKKIPKMTENLNPIAQLRNVGPEDLLGREEVNLDFKSISGAIDNKTVLITGAGGSIGSELSHQIAQFKIKRLILVDISEFNLYKLENSLKTRFPNLDCQFYICDVRSEVDVENIFKVNRPNIIFHAAAYKHVPIMERHPFESIRTNVFGTKNIAEHAIKYKADRFVLVSTDKAVNPTNVMGTTKRVAEIVCQSKQRASAHTKFMIVRFGNVLGSSGSVIPLFKDQIQNRGPVTVTHKDIERFFMSIPEASKLVIQAGCIGTGGEVFVLDMGKPVKILDLALQMIEMSGLRPYKDIDIVFTGLRPGEKLFEEVLLESEGLLPTIHPLVKVANGQDVPENFEELLKNLIIPEHRFDTYCLKKLLNHIVREYVPDLNGENRKQEENVDTKISEGENKPLH